jgi:hypothetical protein
MSRSGEVLYLKDEKMPAVCEMKSIPLDGGGPALHSSGLGL